MGKKSICIIPARGGSKRIPRKNIRSFLGKPIIGYSIEAALECSRFETVMVSTDDEEIASISKDLGADVPFYRSTESADDFAPLIEVVREVVNSYQQMQRSFDVICCLLPTAPFITSEIINEAFTSLKNKDVDSVFSIQQFGYPIQRSLQMDAHGNLSMVWPEFINSRSQDLDLRYHDAGMLYVGKTEAVLKEGTFFTHKSSGILLSDKRCQDIDTQEDWTLAELKYAAI